MEKALRAAFVAAWILASFAPAQTIWWVQPGGTSAGSGTQTDPFNQIQLAINASTNGDTIRAMPGVYFEHINYIGRSVTIESTDGAFYTTIDGQGSGPVVRIQNGESNAVLDGFTVTNGHNSHGAGIYCYGSNVTVRNCIVRDNGPYGEGPGLYAYGGSTRITDTSFENNDSGGNVGGAIAGYYGPMTVERSTFINNRCPNAYGGAIYSNSEFVDVRDCTFVGNQAYYGGAIWLYASMNSLLRDNLFELNTAATGGAILLTNGQVNTIERCRFRQNTASSDGGAISISGSIQSISKSDMSGNTAGGSGGAIYNQGVISVMSGTRILDNHAGGNGGGIYNCSGCLYMFRSCAVARNTASGVGGGLFWCGGCYSSAFTGITFVGNTASSGGATHINCCSAPPFANSVFWSDMPSEFGGYIPCLTNCAVQGGAGCGSSLMALDPEFVNAPFDFHLRSTSPLIGAGANAYVASGETDIDGGPRINGATVDIGADEYNAIVLSAPAVAQIGSPLSFQFATYPAQPGAAYLVDVSVTGDTPGIQLPGSLGTIPLNPPFLFLSYGAYAPGVFVNFLAALDGGGVGGPVLNIPDEPLLIGTVLYGAGLTLDFVGPTAPVGTLSNGVQTVVKDHLPIIQSVVPNTAPVSGNAPITLHGSYFQPGATVTVGGVAPQNVTVVDANTITFTANGQGQGPRDVVVFNPDQQVHVLAGGLTYIPDLVLYQVNPSVTAPGNPVTLSGDGFQSALTLVVGGVPVIPTNVTQSSVDFAMPIGSACDGSLVVHNPSNQTQSIAFNPSPQITSTSGTTIPAGTGGAFTIYGNQFHPGTVVTLGGQPAMVTNSSTGFISATAPPGPAGFAPIVVTSATGCTATTNFYYLGSPPILTSVTLPNGPIAGGTAITLTGANFLPGASVTIGGAAATAVVVVSPTTITCLTPSGTLGTKPVQLVNGDSQVVTLSAGFTYLPNLSVTSASPPSATPGSLITVIGAGFQLGMSVVASGVAVVPTLLSSTQLRFTMPAGTTCDGLLVLSTPSGQNASIGFTPSPVISGVYPPTAAPSGGTPLAIGGAHFYPGTTVTIGGVLVPITGSSSTITLSVVAPPAAAGPAAIVVTSPSGCTATGMITYQ